MYSRFFVIRRTCSSWIRRRCKLFVKGGREGIAIEGLQDVVGRPAFHPFDGGLSVGDIRHHHDFLFGESLLDAPHQFGAVHAGHHEVGDHDLKRFAFKNMQCLFGT